jgi:hypothetical protein
VGLSIANPYSKILVPFSGNATCSVDPTGGYSSSPQTSRPAYVGGQILFVGAGSSTPTLNIQTPWVLMNSNMTLNAGFSERLVFVKPNFFLLERTPRRGIVRGNIVSTFYQVTQMKDQNTPNVGTGTPRFRR